MDDYWVCLHCRSLNRAGSARCYGCKKKYGSRPAEDRQVNRTAAVPAARPSGHGSGSAEAPYLARSLAPASLTAAAGPAIGTSRQPFHLLHPVASVRRRIAWSLAMRQFVSVGSLGYLTATLLTIVCAVGAVVVVQVMPAATSLLRHADLPTARAQLDGNQQRLLGSLSISFMAAALLALICFSVFVGLTTHNATGLGAGQPTLTPYRAGTCWAGALWTQVRITTGLAVPAVLFWSGYTVPGLLVLLVVLEIVHRNVDDLFGWLAEPGRYLPELYFKLGAEGSGRPRLASIWAVLFRLANILAITVSALPLIALAVVAAWAAAGIDGSPGWQSTGLGPAQIAVAVLACSFTCCTAGAVALLVPITLGLVRRQRDRRTLVRVGRARNWVARPGEGSSAQASRYQPTRYSGYDEDRIVERLSPFMTPAESGPEDGAPGFGEPNQDGPTQEEPD